METNKETTILVENVANALVVDIYPKGKAKCLHMSCYKYRHSHLKDIFQMSFHWCIEEEPDIPDSISVTSMRAASFCVGYLGLASHKQGEKTETLTLAENCYISLNCPVPWSVFMTPVGEVRFESYEDGLALAHIMVQFFNRELVR